ncbi:MAG: 4-(cytidine 5'-diphospho)-2-C-methyl-D-erythritol kinase [Proteobacteria bacterium]|nr:4-(cytidine 5'-diphospho)-2-C-methyl-D-erythritol kinase [Pseudomonadota bacterium]
MELLSPAKINLFLHVTGKRSNGYHDLYMLVSAVTLFDRITLDPDAENFTISCSSPHIPTDETNLAQRAARLFKERLNVGGGVAIHLEKNIPAGAGLGGGSSNAATVLRGLNAYFNNPFSDQELISMGLTLGSDVPFFIHGRPAWVSGLGEKIEFCEKIKPYKVVIIFPGIGLSTAEVYKKLNFGLTKSEKKIKSPLLNKGLVDPVKHLSNDLEISAFSICSDIKGLKDVLTIQNAEGVLMSGSGSSVFGLYSDGDHASAACENIKKYALEQGGTKKWQVFLADIIM